MSEPTAAAPRSIDSTQDVARRGPSPPVLVYIGSVTTLSLAVGALSLRFGPAPEAGPLLILCALGVLSVQLREPNVGSRVSFSFLSIVMLASAAIVGPFGAWVVGLVSTLGARRQVRWFQRVFNVSMTALISGFGAWAYLLARWSSDLNTSTGLPALVVGVGVPLILADVVQCLTNAVLLSGVLHFYGGAPFGVLVRQILTTSGVAYIGYGVIGFLFVILWFPAKLGAFSALLVIVPLLAARWAFIQYGEELRSHERTIETLITALARKDPGAAARSRSSARIAEWIAEELALAPSQIGTVRYAAILHEVGRLGVPARLLRQPADSLTDSERRVLAQHCAIGARMIEGIDFLEDARSGIEHQAEHFDGTGGPDGLGGHDIPVAARIVAVAGRFVELTEARREQAGLSPVQAFHVLDGEVGRFDPTVLDAARVVLDRHGWAAVAAGAD
ncbi:MAG: HD domain-containing protein [Humibacillus sp.]|nr:HD domain-containing protein [Humibacillus sp.]MDN5777036.1 HD domain-containing protein [Humibacillus sp.]